MPTVLELRETLRARGLPTTGRKSELEARLAVPRTPRTVSQPRSSTTTPPGHTRGIAKKPKVVSGEKTGKAHASSNHHTCSRCQTKMFASANAPYVQCPSCMLKKTLRDGPVNKGRPGEKWVTTKRLVTGKNGKKVWKFEEKRVRTANGVKVCRCGCGPERIRTPPLRFSDLVF
mmetsp:Transcript_42284/g.51317  ORF Transcript_42284/g.51317 Transcript_42284/m.51317 type:complete len:174 (+) Transcript_42284:199-720(+)